MAIEQLPNDLIKHCHGTLLQKIEKQRNKKLNKKRTMAILIQ
jgi:hypothetical protein